MSFVVHRVSKSAARYTDAGGREKCGYCRFFIAPRACGKVIGPVSPRGWCKYFSRQVSQQYSGSTLGGGGPPGMTLDLNFMSSGNLPAGITFSRASTATYTDASGVIQTAAVNQPRWEARGLLIEEARTNLALRSGDIANAVSWLGVGATAAVGADIAPDGVTLMTRVSENGATAVHLWLQSITISAATTYTGSFYAKAGQVRYLQVVVTDSGDNGGFATFDLQSGTISQAIALHGTGSIGAASIVACGNGVYRCIVSAAPPAAGGRLGVFLSNSPTPGYGPSYAGNASNGLSLWGAQLEQGPMATSAIVTASVGVTRAIDRCGIAPANMAPWFVGATETWFAEFACLNPSPTSPCVIGEPGASSAGKKALTLSVSGGSPFNMAQYDLAGFVQTVNTAPMLSIAKTASAWAAGTGKVCLNGGPVASAALANGYASFATNGFNILTPSTAASNDNMTGYIRRVLFWPRVLSDAEMQQVTT
jgi:hypothetical protein